MKQIFTSAAIVLGSILVSGEAYSAVPGIIKKNGIPDWKSRMIEMKKASKGCATRSAEAAGEVITEAPEGVPMTCQITYSGFFLNMDHIEYVEDKKAPTEVVYAFDGSVYVKDIIAMAPTGAYIKGSYTEEGNVEFKFPQTVYFESDPDYGDMWIDVSLVHSSDLNEEIPAPLTENNSVVFTINYEDMSMEMNPLPEGTSLAMVMNPGELWFGFSETSVGIAQESGENQGVELPEGIESKPYSYIYDTTFENGLVPPNGKPDYGYHVNVAFDGDDVYMGGIFYDAPDSWVKGRKEGNILIFPGKQYLGTMASIGDFFLMFSKWKSAAHDALELLPLDTEIAFEYDEEAGTITAVDKDVIMLMNASEESIRALQMVEDPVYIYQPDASGAPMAPWGLKYVELPISGTFDFNLPNVTEGGTLLFADNMYYNIYVDGSLLEFYADETPDFKEDATDIPYTMNETSIVREKYSSWHQMIIPLAGFETIGVQCVNVWNEEKYYSPLVQLNIVTGEITTGVKGIAKPVGDAVITYYDLTGRKVENPAEGIYVARKTFSDGSVKVAKIVVK